MGTSGLEAAILDFPLPVRSYIIPDCPILWLDLKNIDIAFKIVFLSCLQAEIWVLPVGDRHLGFATSGLVVQHSC